MYRPALVCSHYNKFYSAYSEILQALCRQNADRRQANQTVPANILTQIFLWTEQANNSRLFWYRVFQCWLHNSLSPVSILKQIRWPTFKRFSDSFKYYLSSISISAKRFFFLGFQTFILCVDTVMRIFHNMMLSQILWPNRIYKQGAGGICIILSCIISTAWQHYWDSQGKEDEMGRKLGTYIENINAYNDLVSKLGVKRLLTGSRHTWEDNIKIDVKEIGRGRELDWFVVRKEEVALCCGCNKERKKWHSVVDVIKKGRSGTLLWM